MNVSELSWLVLPVLGTMLILALYYTLFVRASELVSWIRDT